MILLIDDFRDLHADIIARNGNAGLEILKKFKGQIKCLKLDHDLGDGPDGYDIACFLEAYPEYLPEEIEIITGNPAGRLNMMAVFDKLYEKKNARGYSQRKVAP